MSPEPHMPGIGTIIAGLLGFGLAVFCVILGGFILAADLTLSNLPPV